MATVSIKGQSVAGFFTPIYRPNGQNVMPLFCADVILSYLFFGSTFNIRSISSAL